MYGVLLIGILRTRLLPSRYCGICGNILKRRSCCYAGKPAEHITCGSCGNSFMKTPYKTITHKEDPSI